MENPQQPLIQFDSNVPAVAFGGQNAMRGLQLNINKLNTISTLNCDENAAQQPPSYLLPLKAAVNIQPTKPTVIDENFGLEPLKPVATHQHNNDLKDFIKKSSGRQSPLEPSPPKFKLYSRNSLRQYLPPANSQQSSALDQDKQQPAPNRENLLPVINLKEQSQQQQQQSLQRQESIISRIPRLSLRIPLNFANNNTQQHKDVRPHSGLAPLAELKENHATITTIKRLEEPLDHHEDEEIEDIDKSTSRDAIFLVCDIAKDIYDYMYELEVAQAIRQDYLKDQKIFTPKVRQRLVNWCIDIHSQLKLLPETLYMTIAVIDRFFDQVQVKQQSQVQLVAVGCTLIASKYEEIYPPDVGDLMHLTQNSYTRREIMRVEIQILEQLSFDLGKPIPLAFLRRFSKAAHCDTKMHAIAKYLMELSLSEYECSHWRPSMLAAAALYTTIYLTTQTQSPVASIFGSLTRRPVAQQQQQHQQANNKDFWTRSLVHHTHYTRKQLVEPAATLCKILKRAQKSPQSYSSVKKNLQNLVKWPELKSAKVDELIKLGGGDSSQL